MSDLLCCSDIISKTTTSGQSQSATSPIVIVMNVFIYRAVASDYPVRAVTLTECISVLVLFCMTLRTPFISGGTNFGFMNGGNWGDSDASVYQPTITSYGWCMNTCVCHMTSFDCHMTC